MKKLSWTSQRSTSATGFAHSVELPDDVDASGKADEAIKRRSNKQTGVAQSLKSATPPLTLGTHVTGKKSRRKSKTVRLTELLTLVHVDPSALRRMAKDGKFIKPARGVGPRKWNRNAIQHWLAGMKEAASHAASNSYGTSNDPDPEIRHHMAAILHDSIHAVG